MKLIIQIFHHSAHSALQSKSAHANYDYDRILKSIFSCREQSGGGAGPGMMIGGILLGAVLTACGIIAWRKWNRRNGMGYQRSGFGGHSYQVTISASRDSRTVRGHVCGLLYRDWPFQSVLLLVLFN